MDTALVFLILLAIIAVPYWVRLARRRKDAARTQAEGKGAPAPVTLHPHIDLLACIGCGSCVRACPEDVLGLVDGHAAIIRGTHCVGHALCEKVCPVGAITMSFGTPGEGMEIPWYDENYRTNIEGLYIVGELGGIGLIRNAFEQGAKAVGHIAALGGRNGNSAVDVAIVGAGPAGIAAALAAKAQGLRHVILEQDDLGGSILHYPRKKIVLTSPVTLPLHGKLNVTEISKEDLLELFSGLVRKFGLNLKTGEKVGKIGRVAGGFEIDTAGSRFTAANAILALGRRGSPRKLGVPGEDLQKVYYRLIEAEQHIDSRILIVGGGDSAVEAAIALSCQKNNEVTLSYRRDAFVRLKEKNDQRIRDLMTSGAVDVMFKSEVAEIGPESVSIRAGDGALRSLANDVVFVFAGGEMPSQFLQSVGVKMRTAEVAMREPARR